MGVHRLWFQHGSESCSVTLMRDSGPQRCGGSRSWSLSLSPSQLARDRWGRRVRKGRQDPSDPRVPLGAVRGIAFGTIGLDGTAMAELPVGVGSLTDLPALTCYQSETGAVWLPVTDALCTLEETPEGNLATVLVNGMPGWLYYFVVVF